VLLANAVDFGGWVACWAAWLTASTPALGKKTSKEYTTGGRFSVSSKLRNDFGVWWRSEIEILTAAGNMPCCVESHWLSFVVPLAVVSALDVPPLVVPVLAVPLPDVPPDDVPLLDVPAVPP
jgi:hypothetical protein